MPDVIPDPDVVSIETAAKIMGISKTHAYKLARLGQLPGAVKVGATWRVSLIRYRREMHGEAG